MKVNSVAKDLLLKDTATYAKQLLLGGCDNCKHYKINCVCKERIELVTSNTNIKSMYVDENGICEYLEPKEN